MKSDRQFSTRFRHILTTLFLSTALIMFADFALHSTGASLIIGAIPVLIYSIYYGIKDYKRFYK